MRYLVLALDVSTITTELQILKHGNWKMKVI